MTSVRFVERDKLPLMPVMVSSYFPARVEVAVARLSVELAEPVMLAELKLAVTPADKSLTLSFTLSLKTPDGITVTV